MGQGARQSRWGTTHARRRVFAGLLVAGTLAFCALGWSLAGTPEEKAAPATWKPVFPQHRSVIFYCNFDLICQAEPGKLTVDGKPQAWEPFRAPLRVARLGLEPGLHRLRIDEQRVDVFISLGPDEHDWPSDWTTYRSHQMEAGQKRCGVCHRTSEKGGQIEVGPWKGHESCLECHTRAEFDATHCHSLEPLQDCQSCHDIHGSREESLLKGPAKKLCAGCHDA